MLHRTVSVAGADVSEKAARRMGWTSQAAKVRDDTTVSGDTPGWMQIKHVQVQPPDHHTLRAMAEWLTNEEVDKDPRLKPHPQALQPRSDTMTSHDLPAWMHIPGTHIKKPPTPAAHVYRPPPPAKQRAPFRPLPLQPHEEVRPRPLGASAPHATFAPPKNTRPSRRPSRERSAHF